MSTLKIKVRHCPGWRRFRAATLAVSPLSPLWQGEHFAEMMVWAASLTKRHRCAIEGKLQYEATSKRKGDHP